LTFWGKSKNQFRFTLLHFASKQKSKEEQNKKSINKRNKEKQAGIEKETCNKKRKEARMKPKNAIRRPHRCGFADTATSV
jgi:hypothetical protein